MSISVSLDDLKEFYDKDGLTLKDWGILVTSLSLNVSVRAVEQSWGLIFEEVEKLAGTRLENVPLVCHWKRDKGRLPTQTTDLVAKFLALAPYPYIKKRVLEKARSEYLRDLRTRDKRDPDHKRAIRRASTAAYMRLKRAYGLFNKASPDIDLQGVILALMRDEIQEELTKPEGERCSMDDIAERAGREFARKLLGSSRQSSASLRVLPELGRAPTRCPRCGATMLTWDDEDRVYKCMLCARAVTAPNN